MVNKYSIIKPLDEVKICVGNSCIEARGNNAKLLTAVFAIVLVCVGFAVLARI